MADVVLRDVRKSFGSADVIKGVDLEATLDLSSFVGRAPEQVDAFIKDVVEPVRERYAGVLGDEVALKV